MGRDTQILGQLIRHMKTDEVDPLTPLVDDYLLKRGFSPNRLTEYLVPLTERERPGCRLSPSSIGGCKRQTVFKFLGVKGIQRKDPNTELTFDDGNWAHHKWDARFYDMERVLGKDRFKVIGIEKEVMIPDLYIAGSYDAVVRIGGKKWLIDFKTINDFGFNHVYRERKPKEAHIKQLVTYCVARGIKRGMLVYDNKNNPDYNVYTLEVTDKEWAKVNRWCVRVIRSIKDEELPKKHPDCNHGSFLFERCQFAGLCFNPKYEERPEKLRALAFRNFVDIDTAWREGLRAAA
jgi:hypothetical protein